MGGLAEFTTKIYIDFLHLHYETHRHTLRELQQTRTRLKL